MKPTTPAPVKDSEFTSVAPQSKVFSDDGEQLVMTALFEDFPPKDEFEFELATD